MNPTNITMKKTERLTNPTCKHSREKKTVHSEFEAGMESGKHPNKQNDRKAMQSVSNKITPAMVRAYWTGYLCQVQLGGDDLLNSIASIQDRKYPNFEFHPTNA